MRNETVQAWLLGKLVHEGLDAPPTGADRNAMNEFIRAVTKDAGYKYQAGGEHNPSVWVQNYPQHATLAIATLISKNYDLFYIPVSAPRWGPKRHFRRSERSIAAELAQR